jgi:hypothetical protein
VATQSPASGAHVSGAVKVQAAASVEGALGRVDLYVDGVYHSTDTIAPFVFDWDTAGLADGVHTLVTKAYELQNGTEGVAAPLQVIVGLGNVAPTITAIADQVIGEDEATVALAFTIADLDTSIAALALSAASSNTVLVPQANIELAGTGGARTIRIQPSAGMSGVTTITLTVSDGTASAIETFKVSVGDVNDPPTITPISNRAVDEDGDMSVAFTIGDEETAAAALTVSLATSNPAVLPLSAMTLVNSGADYTLDLAPLADQFGPVEITITVSDGVNETPLAFTVDVRPVNDAPTLAALGGITIDENSITGAIALDIGDIETAAGSLVVMVASDNAALVPQARMTLGGSGAQRTLVIAPATNQHGQATITVSVGDGAAITSRSFLLTVVDVNNAPTIAPISNRNTNEDVAIANIPVTIGDDETPPGSLTVSATSDNLDLFPLASFTWFGSGANRNLQIKPAANASGTATVTIAVSDGSLTTTTSFAVEVFPLPDPPTQITLSNSSVRGIVPGGVVGIVGFTDPDPDDSHTWTVSDARFHVVAGRLRLKPGVALDPSVVTSVSLLLTVRDNLSQAANSFRTISVVANPFPWQNPLKTFDIDDDGSIVPLDALWIILDLNASGPRTLTIGQTPWPTPFIDPSGDNFVSPLDALLVINYLNSGGDGEAEPAFHPAAETNDWPAELALWYAWQEDDLRPGMAREED